MRVELIYTPGCQFSKGTLDALETVIAEERLPIPVEIIERSDTNREHSASHTIFIDGDKLCDLPVEPQGDFCRLYNTKVGVSGVPPLDHLHDILYRKWKELTEAPLARFESS